MDNQPEQHQEQRHEQHHSQFHNKEAKLDHDLHDGKGIHAAAGLLKEFESHPKQALALIQHQMRHQSHGDHHNKMHLSIQENGDVFVWDQGEHSGLYAGNIPADMRKQSKCPPTDAQPPAVPAPVGDQAPPPPPGAEQAPPPPVTQDAPGPQGYEYEQPHHHGFHIPFPIDIGVRHGSLHLGVNVLGLVKGGVTLGQQNRGYVGSDALKTEVSAGVDLNEHHIGPAGDWHVFGDGLTAGSARVGITPHHDGINIGAGADASVLGHNAGAGGHGGVELGERVGPHADGYVYAGPAEAAANGYANLSDRGLQAGADGDVGVQPYAGVHAKARVGLGDTNEAHADVGTNIGDNGVSAGAGVYPQFHPDAYVRGYSEDQSAGVGLNPARAWSQDNSQPSDRR